MNHWTVLGAQDLCRSCQAADSIGHPKPSKPVFMACPAEKTSSSMTMAACVITRSEKQRVSRRS